MPPRKLPKTAPKPKSTPKSKPLKRASTTKPKPNGTLLSKPSLLPITATPPSRAHSLSYHYPLLFDDSETSNALLTWFEGIEEARSMPWRKRWIDPGKFEGTEDELSEVLAKRGYEVWVSEISESPNPPFVRAGEILGMLTRPMRV